jgi:lipopolysaccharide export system permease protein
MTLSLYLARRFLMSFGMVAAVFLGILLLVDVVEQLRRFANHPVGLTEAFRLAALNLPTGIYKILPLIVILATLAMFLALARTSELVVARAAGRSGLRLLVAPVLTAFALGLAAVAVLNPIVAATSQQYDVVSDRLRGGDGSVLSISREGLWLREAGAEGQRVIRATRATGDGTRLAGVSILIFGPDGPVARIEAARADLEPGAWALHNAKRWDLTAPNPERVAERTEMLRLNSTLTQARLRDSFGAPASIPIWELPAFIDQLDEAGFSARQHRVWFQMELALPLFMATMVLIGAGFTMRHVRAGRFGMMVLGALLAGFGIFFLRNFAQVLGESGQLPVVLAAWAPPVAGALLSLAFLLHREDA